MDRGLGHKNELQALTHPRKDLFLLREWDKLNFMHFAQDPFFVWMAQYAYQPEIVYLFVVLMMTSSSFGLPIPEEVTIITVSLLAFMGAHPELFPPPEGAHAVVNKYVAAAVVLFAAIGSDFIVYGLGRLFGKQLRRYERGRKWLESDKVNKARAWMENYGLWAVFFFRFTPGLRFPAHFTCGLMRLPIPKFLLVDGAAATISIPTQIILIATYGETILEILHRFKTFFAVAIVLVALTYLGYKIYGYVNRLVSRPS